MDAISRRTNSRESCKGNALGNYSRSMMSSLGNFGVVSTPTIIVANKYVVNTGLGRERVVGTIDYLVEEILADREPTLEKEDSGDADDESTGIGNGEIETLEDVAIEASSDTAPTVEGLDSESADVEQGGSDATE